MPKRKARAKGKAHQMAQGMVTNMEVDTAVLGPSTVVDPSSISADKHTPTPTEKEVVAHPQRVLRAETKLDEPGDAAATAGSDASGGKRQYGEEVTPDDARRKARQGPTPNQKPAKKQSTKRAEMVSALRKADEKALLGVLVLAQDPIQTLTMGQINLVRNELMQRLKEVIVSGRTPVPTFNESGIIKGRFQ